MKHNIWCSVLFTNRGLNYTKTICSLTGFNPTLLRAWEHRYGFLEPIRQPSGHRLYTEDDLTVLEAVRVLIDSGQTVGEAAALGRRALLNYVSDLSGVEVGHAELSLHRLDRYRGDDLGVSLYSLRPSDLLTVSRVYEVVRSTYELWLYLGEEGRDDSLVLSRLFELRVLRGEIARLGVREEGAQSLRTAALADCRGAALSLLLGTLSRLSQPATSAQVHALVLLARDQGKMMRNSFYDIDPHLRRADENPKAHSLDGVVSKLQGVCENLEVSTNWSGHISSCGLESSALERVIYDTLRRVQATGSAPVKLSIRLTNLQLLRWQFQTEGPVLATFQKDDLSTMVIANSVGVSPEIALARRYLGCRGSSAWFHWPIFATV